MNLFIYVKPKQRHDDIIISTRSLFRKSFSFYTLIISYINLNKAIIIWLSLLKAYLEQYQTLILYKIYVKKISKIQVLRHLCF